jgi:hypothetical protein
VIRLASVCGSLLIGALGCGHVSTQTPPRVISRASVERNGGADGNVAPVCKIEIRETFEGCDVHVSEEALTAEGGVSAGHSQRKVKCHDSILTCIGTITCGCPVDQGYSPIQREDQPK